MLNESDCPYSVFGLALRSNLPIPGLTKAGADFLNSPVHLHMNISPYTLDQIPRAPEMLAFQSAFLNTSGEPVLRIWDVAGKAYLRLAYSDGIQFWLDREGNNVWSLWPDDLSIEDASTYLLGPVLGLLLRLRGVTCLHASAIAIGGRAVAFVGPAGAGKSTTAAALARCGYSVLSDDIVALSEEDGTFHVMPAYPYLSLWPESVGMLFGSPDALPRFTGSWDKRYLADGSGGVRFEESPLQLGAIYLLGERSGNSAPRVEAVAPQAALISLVANTYATNTLDSQMRAMEFAVLGRLVSSVAVRRICPHEDPLRIDDLCRLICRDFEDRPSYAAFAILPK
jgi:hypothetical protein